MPAKYIKRVDKVNGFFHISNKSVPGRNIFNDKEDYETFLSFLETYLNPVVDLNSYKKEFEIRGEKYLGMSYLPQNYHNKIDLIVYTLLPDHFHLVLCQLVSGSLERFMRSLSTRYSMYYNKKYGHQGSLFRGPYKSALIENESSLLYLSHYLHREASTKSKYSSYEAYTGKAKLPWLKNSIVLSILNNIQNPKLKNIENYQKFVENYNTDDNDLKASEYILLDNDYAYLVRSNPPNKKDSPYINKKLRPVDWSGHTFFKFSLATSLYILLFSFGYNNIQNTAGQQNNDIISKYIQIIQNRSNDVELVEIPNTDTNKVESFIPLPTESVAGVSTQENAKFIRIKIDNEKISSVNIRQDPFIDSKIVASAKDGEKFEYTQLDNGWYQIKLEDGLGYVFSDLVEIIKDKSI